MNIQNRNKHGFTLMELVVTTAIMGTLAAVAVPKFAEQQEEAKVRTTLVNISIIGQTLSTDFQNRLTRQGMDEAKFSSPTNSHRRFGHGVYSQGRPQ